MREVAALWTAPGERYTDDALKALESETDTVCRGGRGGGRAGGRDAAVHRAAELRAAAHPVLQG